MFYENFISEIWGIFKLQKLSIWWNKHNIFTLFGKITIGEQIFNQELLFWTPNPVFWVMPHLIFPSPGFSPKVLSNSTRHNLRLSFLLIHCWWVCSGLYCSKLQSIVEHRDVLNRKDHNIELSLHTAHQSHSRI